MGMLLRPQVSYPGVYVQEVFEPSSIIPAIPTSLTAFVGRTRMGPVDAPTEISSVGDFQRQFGGAWEDSPLSYAVSDYFNNGGAQALIVRLYASDVTVGHIQANNKDYKPSAVGAGPVDPKAPPAAAAKGAPSDGIASVGLGADNVPKKAVPNGKPTAKAKDTKKPVLIVHAANPGIWGNYLTVVLDQASITSAVAAAAGVAQADLFNIRITYSPPWADTQTEYFTKVSVAADSGQYRIDKVLAQQSQLVSVRANELPAVADMRPVIAAYHAIDKVLASQLDSPFPAFVGGNDGYYLDDPYYFTNDDYDASQKGVFALEQADIFNLLCIPRDRFGVDIPVSWPDVFSYVQKKRAFWILEAPVSAWQLAITAGGDVDSLINQAFQAPGDLGRNAAVYWPDVIMPDPLAGNAPRLVGPAGLVAGVYARTDQTRGVWKAPAGTAATLIGVSDPQFRLNDDKNGRANLVGVNCLRTFRNTGPVVWGARTLAGAEALEDPHKYVPVRRLTSYIEESLYRGLQWAVFEPNHETLWASIRLQINGFMTGLMKQGAFQGFSQKQAYFVLCDSSTTSADDIERGICNVVVGFAPVKPAEFVVLYFEQLTADANS